MIGLLLIILGIVVLLSHIPIIPVVIFGPQGWQIKMPSGIFLILIGVYLDYGATITDIFGF